MKKTLATPATRASTTPAARTPLTASGLGVCVDFDPGYSPAEVLVRLLNRNRSFSQRNAVEFGRLAREANRENLPSKIAVRDRL